MSSNIKDIQCWDQNGVSVQLASVSKYIAVSSIHPKVLHSGIFLNKIIHST